MSSHDRLKKGAGTEKEKEPVFEQTSVQESLLRQSAHDTDARAPLHLAADQLERFPELVYKRRGLIEAYIRALDGYSGIKVYPNVNDAKLCEGSTPAPWLACVELPPRHVHKRDVICQVCLATGTALARSTHEPRWRAAS